MDLQFYTQKFTVESQRDTSLVTLEGIDISELQSQVSINDLLDGWDYDIIQDYLTKRLQEDAE